MVTALVATPTASAAAISLEALMDQLALDSAEVTLGYRQIQRSRLLSEPTTTPGRITIHRNGRIRQQWQGEDGTYRLAVDGDRAHLMTPDSERRFGLGRRPRLAALIAALRAITSGDANGLRERFDVSLEGDESQWRLKLSASDGMRATPGQLGHEARAEPATLILTGGSGIQRIRLTGDGRDTEIIVEDAP